MKAQTPSPITLPRPALALALACLGLPVGLHVTGLSALYDLSCYAVRRGCAAGVALRWSGALLVVAGVFALSLLFVVIAAAPSRHALAWLRAFGRPKAGVGAGRCGPRRRQER